MAVGQLRLEAVLGRLLRIVIETVQLIAGTESQVLFGNKYIEYVDSCWVVQLQKNLIKVNVGIKIPSLWNQKKTEKE